MKRGRFSKEEMNFIKSAVDEEISYQDIGEKLDRDPESIQKYVEEKLKLNISPAKKIVLEAQYDIQSRPYWQDLEQQFTPQELERFKYEWGRIIAQFRDDVPATEELQILDMIKLEVLSGRTLMQTAGTNKLVIELEAKLVALERLVADDPTTAIEHAPMMQQYMHEISAHRAALGVLSKEYRDLTDKKGSILKEMKGTREQRVKKMESKVSFGDWMKSLLTNVELRERLGIDMEKMRLAADYEVVRLSEYHEFINGEVDQPLLTPETVKDDNG